MLQTLRKPVLILVAVLAFYALCGFFLLPAVLQAKLPELIQQEMARKASIGKITFNPFTLRFALADFAIQERDDAEAFVAFKSLTGDISGFGSIRHWAPVIDEMNLQAPLIRIAKSETGVLNFADLLEPSEAPEKETAAGIFPFLIRNLTISEGACVWEDRRFKKPEKETMAPIDLSLAELSTLGTDPSSLHLSLVLSSGGRLDWTGNTVIQPLHSAGSIRIDRLNLPRLGRLLLQEPVPVKLEDGTAKLAADYEFSAREDGYRFTLGKATIGLEKLKLVGRKQSAIPAVALQDFSFTADYDVQYDGQATQIGISRGQLVIANASVTGNKNTPGIPDMKLQQLKIGADTDLVLSDQGLTATVKQGMLNLSHFGLSENNQRDELIGIRKVAVKGINVDSARQRFNIASIESENANIKAWLDANGRINYQSLLSAPVEPSADDQRNEPKTPWQIRLDKIVARNYRINFTDRTQETPVVFDLADLNIELDNFDSGQATKSPLRLHTRVNDAGEIKISGETALSPLSAELAVDVSGLDLKTAQPYLEKYVRLEIIDGYLSTQGKLSAGVTEPDQLRLNYQGNAEIAHLLTRDRIQNKDFVKWDRLGLAQISFDLTQRALTLEEVVFDKPYGRMIIKKNGTTNIQDIVAEQKSGPEAAPASERTESRQKPFTFKIGKIRVKQGMSDFADYSLILPFITQMNSLEGTLLGLSSDKDATAKLSLTGKVYDLASVDIAGRYQIGTGDSVVKLSFKNMPLPLVTPYMAEFAGYKIEKGQMSLDLSYSIDKGRLKAENNMFIDQFTLGEKVESPNAVSLPLNLAIALLKDSDGKINLDLPITGSLDDPEFSVSALVFKALGNLITKIVTSPFHAIASLVDGDQDLSLIRFSAGSAELDMTEKVKLSKLAEALKSRPSLRLDIKGAAYQEQDWEAMRYDALKDQLKKMKAKELKAEGTKIRAEYVELSDDDYKRLLAKSFIEKFPLLAQYSFFGTPELKNPEEGDFYEIARQKLEAIMQPEKQRLDNLAMQRASTIAKYLIEQGGIGDGRVFILATELDPVREEAGITVSLSLNVGS